MDDLKISIVMPSYNQVDFIGESINSILGQSYRNFELIIVDGLSKDGSVEKIKGYEGHSNIKKIIVEKDNGQSDALYKGFQYCTGDIYAWLNSDDVYMPGAFECIIEQFRRNPGIEVINGELVVINEKSEFVAKWPRKVIATQKWLHYPQTIGQPSTFFRAELYHKVGGINPLYNYAMDYDLFLKFALAKANFKYLDEVIAGFRVHGQSKTMALPYKFWKEEIKVFHKLSNKKILSGFYYWKFRGIVGTIVRQRILKTRKY